ncbi:peptidylprolyl isomerase [Azospirillum sp. sgz301742]
MKRGLLLASWIASAAILLPTSAYPQSQDRPADAIIAKVASAPITMMELDAVLARTVRQSFYHGSVTPERLVELRQKVLGEMITERLVLAEARKRGIGPDEAAVEERLAGFEKQYKDSPQWPQMREEAIPALREKMRENSLRARLEAQVRDVAAPTEAQLKTFYKDNISSFTEPQRTRVSVILLKVDPSAPRETWDAARQEAERIRARLLKGESFADLAKMHSNDPSANNGGDMGYLHRGMLPGEIEEALEKLAIGKLSEPLLMLQGYGVFQLTERLPAQVRKLEDVRERATELYRRNTGEKRWAELAEKLRRETKIWIDEPFKPKPSAARN